MPEAVRVWLRRAVMLGAVAVIAVGLLADRTPRETDRAASIAARLRCPVCQGESIADSPSGIARELQGVVREQVAAGRTDAEIEAFFQERYGGWVLLDPPRRGATLVLWVLPGVALAAGVAVVYGFWSSRRRVTADEPAADPLGAPGRAAAAADARESAEPSVTAALRADARRGASRSLAGTLATAAACGVLAVSVSAAARPSPNPAGGASATTTTMPASAGRDLATVTEAEMEEVVAANPQVVPMRLALVERYLRKGDREKADQHAAVALRLAEEPADRQRALKLAGWLAALGGDPAKGSELLTRSLELEPDDLDSQWFLANVRLTGLGDAVGAVTLLEAMLRRDIPAEKRAVVEQKLAEARAAA